MPNRVGKGAKTFLAAVLLKSFAMAWVEADLESVPSVFGARG
jgi:hypothetical protein